MFPKITIPLAVLAALSAGNVLAQKQLSSYLGSLTVEPPQSYENLTIFPLSTTKYDDKFTVLTLDQAQGQGVLQIKELGSGQVNRVMVENKSGQYVFLMAGEILSGCKQDRMVANDCLLPPKSGSIELSVYCVEHGRWTSQSRDFKSAKTSAHVRMRQVAKESGSQQQVWDEVRSKASCLSVAPAPTEALTMVLEDKEVQERCRPYTKHFERRPVLGRNTVGVAVASGSEIICIDIFATPQILENLWPKLLSSYIIDVIDRPEATGSTSRPYIASILNKAALAELEKVATDGLGQAWKMEHRDLSGSALCFKNIVVHCDIFPRRTAAGRDENAPKLDFRRQRTR